jgi:hypothetical protein
MGPLPEFMPAGCELAVLQGDPGEHNADVFFKLPGGTTAPHQWHTILGEDGADHG